MIRSGGRDLVVRRRERLLSSELLESGLVVLAARTFSAESDVVEQKTEHDLGRALPAGVDEHCSEDCFEGVGQDRFLVTTARLILASTEQQLRANTDPASDLGQRCGVHDRRSELRQLTFRQISVDAEDVLGDSESENSITKELEPFVRLGCIGLGAVTPVGERELEQSGIGELVSQVAGEIVRVGRLVQESAPTWPKT